MPAHRTLLDEDIRTIRRSLAACDPSNHAKIVEKWATFYGVTRQYINALERKDRRLMVSWNPETWRTTPIGTAIDAHKLRRLGRFRQNVATGREDETKSVQKRRYGIKLGLSQKQSQALVKEIDAAHDAQRALAAASEDVDIHVMPRPYERAEDGSCVFKFWGPEFWPGATPKRPLLLDAAGKKLRDVAAITDGTRVRVFYVFDDKWQNAARDRQSGDVKHTAGVSLRLRCVRLAK